MSPFCLNLNMRNITYLFAPIGSNYTEKIIQIISNHMGNDSKVYIITSSNLYAEKYKRLISQNGIKYTPGQIMIGTILYFAEKILDNQKILYNSLSPAEEQLLIYKLIMDSSKSKDEIEQIRTLSKVPSYYDILLKLKEQAIKKEDVYRYLKNKNIDDSEKNTILKIFFQELGFEESERKYSNSYKILKSINYIKNFINNRMNNILIVDGFYELTKLQKIFLQEAIKNVTNCYIRLIKGSNPVYEYCSVDHTYFGTGKSIYIEEYNKHNIIADIRRLIFNNENYLDIELNFSTKKYELNCDSKDIKIIKCSDRESEVEIACKTIKHWILNGINPSEICVTYRGGYDYSKLFRFYLNKYRIPYKEKIPCTGYEPLSEFILKLIELNISNFERDKLLDFLKCNLLNRHFDREIVLKFEKISSRWGIIYGEKAWIKACDKRKAYLNFILENYLEDEATQEKESIKNEIKILDEIRALLSKFLNIFHLEKKATLKNYIKSLLEITSQIGSEIESPYTKKLLNLFHSLFNNSSHRISLNTLLNILTNLLYQKIEYRSEDYGVTISDVMNIRGAEPECMVILGFVDGEFPLYRYDSKWELSLKEELNTLFNEQIFDIGKKYLVEEQFLLYYLISSTKSKLMLTYPEFDLRRKQLQTSPFIYEVANVLKSLSKSFYIESYNSNNIELTIDTAYNEQELLDASSLNKEIISVVAPEKYKFIIERARIENWRINRIYNSFTGKISNNSLIMEFFKKNISISRLHEYTKCPFYFACKNIWKIEVVEEPYFEIDRMMIGLIIHKLLEEYVKDFLLRKEINPELSWAEYLEQYDPECEDEMIENLIKEYNHEISLLPPMIRNQKLEFLKLGLKNFIDYEIALSKKSNYQPIFAEKEVKAKINELSLPDGLKEVNFISKIDRIDYNIDYNGYTIIEYKLSSSSIPNTLKSLEEKRYLQIPFYLLMLKYNRGYSDKPILGGVYFSFKDGTRSNAFSKIQLIKRQNKFIEDLDEKLNTTKNILSEIINKIYQGDFSVKPFDSNECKNCEYSDVCHVYY